MAMDREILILQGTSSIRVQGARLAKANWSLVRHQNLAAAGVYLDSAKASIGIIDLSCQELPSKELERWLVRYNGIYWIAILSKHQLLKKEWQLLVASHCYDYHTLPILDEKLFITVGRAYGMSTLKNRLNMSLQQDVIIGRHEKLTTVVRELHYFKSGVLTLSGALGTGKRLLAKSWCSLNGLKQHILDASSFNNDELISIIENILINKADKPCLVITHVERLNFFEQEYLYKLMVNNAKNLNVIFCCDLCLLDLSNTSFFTPNFLIILKRRWLEVPLLQDRGQDKLLLAKYYLYKISRDKEKNILAFSADAEQAILNYDWPGNISELISKIARGVDLCTGYYVDAEHLELTEYLKVNDYSDLSLQLAREKADTLAIKKVLKLAANSPEKASHLLGISRASLYRLIARYGIRKQI